MLTTIHSAAFGFAIKVDTLLQRIRVLRPDLDLAKIQAWAASQAQADAEHDALHYLAVADRAVVAGEPLPWLPAPSGLTPPLPVTN